MNVFEEIEAYTYGSMSEQERIDFEERLQTDAVLQKAFDDWMEASNILEKHQLAEQRLPDLKAILQPLTKEYFGEVASERKEEAKSSADKTVPPKGKVVQMRRWLIGGIAVAALFLIYFLNPASIDSFDVNPMPNAVVRGAEDASKRGAVLFNEGKYKEAVALLKEAAMANPGDATAQYYYGIALVKTGQYETAMPIFKQLSDGPSAFKEDGYFFVALSAWHLKKEKEAALYAAKVSEANQYYKNAQLILKKLQ